MKPIQWALALGFFLGIFAGVQTSAQAADGRGFPRGGGGVSPNASFATVTSSGNGTFGSLTVTTPGDLTLGAGSDLNLGNNASSGIRGGSGLIELGDYVGYRASYGANNLFTMTSVDNTSTTTNGTTIITGDTTSPAKPAFRITPQDAVPTGASVVGDMYVTTAGLLKICVTAGTPCGSWVSVGAQ